jgi:protein gp37
MYPWVSHMHAHLGGECPHRCSYCYVDSPRFGRPVKFTGPLRMLPGELDVNYGAGRTIFVDHCNDLFAEDVPAALIMDVLNHCASFPGNTYVFQTKNPGRFGEFAAWAPPTCLVGCTIETNRNTACRVSQAPPPQTRAMDISAVRFSRRVFVTIEPIMDFDVPVLGEWLMEIRPEFVNIGADSKGHHLQEPAAEKVLALIDVLRAAGIKIRGKHNLARIVGESKL